MTIDRLSILGFGLLGGSIAQAVQKHLKHCQISIYDIDSAYTAGNFADRVCSTARQAAADARLIVLCVPPASVAPLLREIRNDLHPDAVITDVTSVKRSVVAHAQSILDRPERFVGSHPMAGGERSGSAASRADLFEGSAVVMTPLESTDPDAVKRVEAFWRSIGATTSCMSPESHDRAVAEISHLPHVLASLLMHTSNPDSRSIAGAGFKDLTRLASGDPSLWQQILSDNGDEIRHAIRHVERQLSVLDSLLDPARTTQLRDWLAAAAKARQTLGRELKS